MERSVSYLVERATLRAFAIWLFNRNAQDHKHLSEMLWVIDLYLKEMYDGKRTVR